MKGAFVLAEERPDNVGYRTFRRANPCNTGVRLLSLPSTENPYHRMLKTPQSEVDPGPGTTDRQS